MIKIKRLCLNFSIALVLCFSFSLINVNGADASGYKKYTDITMIDKVLNIGNNEIVITSSQHGNGDKVAVKRLSADGKVKWSTELKGHGIYFIKQNKDGSFILKLYRDYAGGYQPNADRVIKMDANGVIVWNKKFTDLNNISDIVETSTGDFIMVGYKVVRDGDSYNSIYSDPIIRKLDKNGSMVWTKNLNVGKNLSSIFAKNNGNVIVFSSDDDTDNKSNFYVTEIDTNGNKIWNKAYSSKRSYIYSVVTNGNDFFVDGPNDAVIKIDNNGKKLWEIKSLDKNEMSPVHPIYPSKDGGFIYIAHEDYYYEINEKDKKNTLYSVISKVDKNGKKQWVKKYAIDKNKWSYNEFNSVVETKDNGFVVVGSSWIHQGNDKISYATAIKYDAYGAVEWQKKYSAIDSEYSISFADIVSTSDNNYVAVGINVVFQDEYEYSSVASGFVAKFSEGTSQIIPVNTINNRTCDTIKTKDRTIYFVKKSGVCQRTKEIVNYGDNTKTMDYKYYKIKGDNGEYYYKQVMSSKKIVRKNGNKTITVYHGVNAYYSNGNVKASKYIKRGLNNKYTSQIKKFYNKKEKLTKMIQYTYQKNGKVKYRYEYIYNKGGALKSNNKYGKAYRYVTVYSSKGKVTYKQTYDSKGKLSKTKVKVKLRVGI